MQQYNFYAAYLQLQDFYGIELKDDDFESYALHAWDHIGNKNYRIYTYCGEVDEHGNLDLPCNVDIIEGVFKENMDITRTDGISYMGPTISNMLIEDSIEQRRLNASEFYNKGGYINYTQHNNTLNFNDYCGNVTIMYKGVYADEDGLPYLNFKEVDAIAKYCAFIHMQKQAYITKDKSTFELAQLARQQWQQACDNARTPIYLNQNDVDKILNVQSSWDRKRFGLSFKMLR